MGKTSDPRRRTRAVNPLSAFRRSEPCWCGSDKSYGACHAIGNLSQPGAPLPADPDDGVFIAPNVLLDRGALMGQTLPTTVTTQFPRPQATPVQTNDLVASLIAQPPLRPMSHQEIGSLRYARLDSIGLVNAAVVREGDRDTDLSRIIPDLATGSLELARATVDRLSLDATSTSPPVVLHHDQTDIARVVGQTLFWADHYTVRDPMAVLAARGVEDVTLWRSAVAELLELRPLVLAGIVVPVLSEIVTEQLREQVIQATDADLADTSFVRWLERQIVVEGPTQREAAFVHVIDDFPHEDMLWLLARQGPKTPGGSPTLQNLQRWDPTHDYGEWLKTVRRQGLARLVQNLTLDLTTADVFGARILTSSPFRARALRRRRAPALPSSSDFDVTGAVWANVPWLPQATSATLAKIARDEERVIALRHATASALQQVEAGDVGASAQAIADVAGDLRMAAEGLTHKFRTSAALDALFPGGLATGSVLLAGTFSFGLGAAGLLAAGAAAVPPVRQMLNHRHEAAYAFWMARPR